MNITDKLYTVKYTPDEVSHLKPDLSICRTCKTKVCEKICPANVYEWDEQSKNLIINYENCLECGACRIACSHHCLKWEYPKGTNGITFKLG